MFYLKEFSKLFKSNLILSLILGFSIFGLVTSVQQKELIKQEFSLNQKTKMVPYFNALISNKVSLESIQRKMIKLPGVFQVNIDDNKSLKEELGHLEKNFGSEIIGELSSLNYNKIKIQLEEGIHNKNQELVREYLARLVGKDSLTMGAVKLPQNIKLKDDDALLVFVKYLDVYLVLFFMVLAALCVFLLVKPLNNQAYIIEKFQRKSRVNMKILFSGLFSIASISFILNYLYRAEFNLSSLAVVAYVIMLPMIFLMTRKLTYKV